MPCPTNGFGRAVREPPLPTAASIQTHPLIRYQSVDRGAPQYKNNTTLTALRELHIISAKTNNE